MGVAKTALQTASNFRLNDASVSATPHEWTCQALLDVHDLSPLHSTRHLHDMATNSTETLGSFPRTPYVRFKLTLATPRYPPGAKWLNCMCVIM